MKRTVFVFAILVGAGCADILGLDELPLATEDDDGGRAPDSAPAETGPIVVPDSAVDGSADADALATGPCRVPGSVAWGGHCYLPVRPGLLRWDVAEARARDAGGYLAVPDSEEENTFLYALAVDAGLPAACPFDGGDYCGPWLGGFQPSGSVEPGEGWQWLTGQPIEVGPWSLGEPNNGGGDRPPGSEQAVAFHRRAGSSEGQWGDFPGTNTFYNIRGYIVEYDR